MARKKAVSTKSVKEEEEFIPDPIVTDEVTKNKDLNYDEDIVVVENEVTKDEQAAVKTVANKKGLSSFGELLKAQNAKRKERNKKYGKEN